jgi:hypothetical protein
MNNDNMFNVELMMNNSYLSLTKNKTFNLGTPHLVMTQKDVLEVMLRWFESRDEYEKCGDIVDLMNNKKIEFTPLTTLDLETFNHQINMYRILQLYNLL